MLQRPSRPCHPCPGNVPSFLPLEDTVKPRFVDRSPGGRTPILSDLRFVRSRLDELRPFFFHVRQSLDSGVRRGALLSYETLPPLLLVQSQQWRSCAVVLTWASSFSSATLICKMDRARHSELLHSMISPWGSCRGAGIDGRPPLVLLVWRSTGIADL